MSLVDIAKWIFWKNVFTNIKVCFFVRKEPIPFPVCFTNSIARLQGDERSNWVLRFQSFSVASLLNRSILAFSITPGEGETTSWSAKKKHNVLKLITYFNLEMFVFISIDHFPTRNMFSFVKKSFMIKVFLNFLKFTAIFTFVTIPTVIDNNVFSIRIN